jgi:hypothetical protein
MPVSSRTWYFRYKSLRLLFKKKIRLPRNQLVYVKRKALLQWLKTVVEYV